MTRISHRLFETSERNLELFDLEPIVSLAEALVDDPRRPLWLWSVGLFFFIF